MSGAAPEQGDLAEPMRSRWSPSVLDPDREPTDDELALLLAAARWAPSWGNTQPWAFVVVRRGGPGHADLVSVLSRGNRAWVPAAPVVLVTAHQHARAPGDEKDAPSHAAYDLGQAAAHLTLQATAMGLATHQFAGFDRDRWGELAGVPPWWRVTSGIAVGHRGDPSAADPGTVGREERPRRRRPVEEVAHAGAWGRPWRPGGDG